MRINYIHVLIALGLGAILMHMYRTKTTKGRASGQ
jgi:hypothetical protein